MPSKKPRAAANSTTTATATGASRDKWVAKIDDPAQKALARAIPDICAIFGVNPEHLVVRVPARAPAGMVVNSHTKVCLGAVAFLGRELGIKWDAMHGRTDNGVTQIRELVEAHRMSLTQFSRQFAALIGQRTPDDGGGDADAPIGEVGSFVRARFLQLRADVLAPVAATEEGAAA
jgi:hypothetical protein